MADPVAQKPVDDDGFEEDPANTPAKTPADPAPETPAADPAPPTPAADAAPAAAEAPTSDIAGKVATGNLHTTAKEGTPDNVQMLLQNKADPGALDSEGKTALQYAQARTDGEKDKVVGILEEAMGIFKDDFEEVTPAPSPTANSAPAPAPATPAAAASPANSAPPASPPAASSSRPAVEIDAPRDSLDDAIQENINTDNQSPKSSNGKSPKKLSDHKDLKAATMFSSSTVDGVLKRTTFIHKLSSYPSAPEITIGSRGESMFVRSQAGPAPGSYNLPDDNKTKFKSSGMFSFGGGSRFGLGQSPTKLQPGPGAYNAKDPSLTVDTKVGFGTSVRGKTNSASQANPGPGAYENRSTVGGGLMFTAAGRHPTSYMRSRSLPGPGAYTPTLTGAYQTSPKCGFGTSTRGDFGGGVKGQPGPGTYEMQNAKALGKDAPKFSATSRRRMHDLNSYVTPGPGTYNAHATNFGSPGAHSCRHTDEGYKARNTQTA